MDDGMQRGMQTVDQCWCFDTIIRCSYYSMICYSNDVDGTYDVTHDGTCDVTSDGTCDVTYDGTCDVTSDGTYDAIYGGTYDL